MPQSWAKLVCDTWTDRKFMSLSTDARLLFIWAWTNDKAAACGLYECPSKWLVRGLGRNDDIDFSDEARVENALRELHDARMVLFDQDNEVIWVVNRVKHANTSARAAALMQKEVRVCPDSPLVEKFLRRYGRELGFDMGQPA